MKNIEFVYKLPPPPKSLKPREFQWRRLPNVFKKRSNTNSTQTLSKNTSEGYTSQFILQSQYYNDTKTYKKTTNQ